MKRILLIAISCTVLAFTTNEPGHFRSPIDLKFSPDGKKIAVTVFTKGSVYFIDPDSRRVLKELNGFNQPFGLAWDGNNNLIVAEYGAHVITRVDARKYKKENSIACVKYPMGITITPDRQVLVAGFGKSELGVVNLQKNHQEKTILCWYQPDFVSASPDGNIAVVANLTPRSSINGSKISVVDLKAGKLTKDVELPFGSTNLRQLAISNDGKWAYVAHTYGKVMLPTSQIERGWINANVISIIDLENLSVYATFPLDFVNRGAADPWGLALSKDGEELYVTLAGVNELAVIQIGKLHSYLSGQAKPDNLRKSDANAEIAYDVWQKISTEPKNRKILIDQFSALYAAGLLQRYPLEQSGTRGIEISPDGKYVLTTGYYSGDVSWFNIHEKKTSATLNLGGNPKMTLARKGEMIFHSADNCFQNWLSCATCHPAGRADGMNWDLLNDGIGNPKNAKSLLLSHATPPVMSLGVRASYSVAIEKGFHFIQFNLADKKTKNAVKAYLSSMQPEPSPYLDELGGLSDIALRGKELFESDEVGCIKCHHGEYYTDLEMYNISSKSGYDRNTNFDNPTLVEVWRSAPYLHSGKQETLKDMFSKKNNANNQHGSTVHLSEKDLGALVEYVLSL